MKFKFSAISLALSICCLTATAAEVDQQKVVTFEAGTPAKSAEMNETIQALISAINDNNTRIAALEAASARSVAGRSYAVRGIGMIFLGGSNSSYPDGFGTVSAGNYTDTGTIDFFDDGTFDLSASSNEGEIGMNDGDLYQSGATADSFSVTGNWQQNGADLLLTLVIPGEGDENVSIMVSKDGSTLVSAEFYSESDPDACSDCNRVESSLLVGVEI